MSNHPEHDFHEEPHLSLDDAQYAIVALALTSFTLIVFVLIIILWMT